jgi:hypothetical protein
MDRKEAEGLHFKITTTDGLPLVRTGEYALPTGRRPGKWMPKMSPVVTCQTGYHVLTVDQIVTYDYIGPRIWIVEVRGKNVDQADKSAYEQMRFVRELDWNLDKIVEFAKGCAEHVAGTKGAEAREAAWEAAQAARAARAAAEAREAEAWEARAAEHTWQTDFLLSLL